jgi:hypothetical protein
MADGAAYVAEYQRERCGCILFRVVMPAPEGIVYVRTSRAGVLRQAESFHGRMLTAIPGAARAAVAAYWRDHEGEL